MTAQLLTTKQAANILGVSASFLEHDRINGAKLPFVRVGARSIRYRHQDVDSFVQSRIHLSTSSYQTHK